MSTPHQSARKICSKMILAAVPTCRDGGDATEIALFLAIILSGFGAGAAQKLKFYSFPSQP